jgi:hypothetical protein
MPRRTRAVAATDPSLPLFAQPAAAPPAPVPLAAVQQDTASTVLPAPVEAQPPESEGDAMVGAYLVEHAADNARGETAFEAAVSRGEDVRDAAGAYLAAACPAPLGVRVFLASGGHLDVFADTPDGPITSPRSLTSDELHVTRETFRSILRDAEKGITCTGL